MDLRKQIQAENDKKKTDNGKIQQWETSEEAYTTEQYEEFAAAFDAATKA